MPPLAIRPKWMTVTEKNGKGEIITVIRPVVEYKSADTSNTPRREIDPTPLRPEFNQVRPEAAMMWCKGCARVNHHSLAHLIAGTGNICYFVC